MSLSQMAFDKVWTNPADFPTHETQEVKVREDMQYLFDSIKNQFNNFIFNEFTAENTTFAPTEAIVVTTVQDAIEFVYEQMQGITQGGVPDGSITSTKLASKAVTSAKIDDGAVGTAALADDAVTGAKLADGTITSAKLADGGINGSKIVDGTLGTDKFANNSVTDGKLANNAVVTARIKDGAVTSAKLASSAVEADKIAAGAVTEAKIGSGAVTSGKLGAGSVIEAKIGSGAVTEGKIGTGAVTTNKIFDGAVTFAKTTGVQATHKQRTVTLTAGLTSWTVTCSGVTTTNTVIASNAPGSFDEWRNCGIHLVSQSADTLGFSADAAPANDVDVNIAIFDL